MTEKAPTDQPLSEVATWHKLSGLPDNVADDGTIVKGDAARQAGVEKELLRGEIARLSAHGLPEAVRNRARLAASYLLAGDVETAQRYIAAAQELLGRES